MSKTGKILSILALALLAGFIFYGSTKEIIRPAEEEDTSGWLHRSGSVTVWYTDERLTGFISKAAVEFGEAEDVTVVPVLMPSEKFLEECYNASLSGVNYPDVIILGSENLEKAYLSGLAAEIDDPDMQCGPLNFSDAAINAVTYQGKKLGYPLYFDTSVMVYNRTYLEQWASMMALADLTGNAADAGGGESESEEDANSTGISAEDVDRAELEELTKYYIQRMVPYTLEDLMTIANSYSVPEGVEGIMKWDVSSIMYNYWIMGGATSIGGVCGDDRQDISISNEEAVQCLTKYQSLHDYFSIESSDVSYESVIQDFIDGKTVFTIGGYDLVKKLADATADGSLVYEYGFSEMPNITTEILSSSLSLTTAAIPNGYSDKRQTAEKLALYLTRDGSSYFTDYTGLASASRSFGWEGGADQIYAMEYAGSVSLPKMMEAENFWMQTEAAFSRIWEGGDVEEELSILENNLRSGFSESESL